VEREDAKQSSGGEGKSRDLEEGEGGEEPLTRLQKMLGAVKRHAAFIGPGVIASVAYLDPVCFSFLFPLSLSPAFALRSCSIQH
jgi:hypothetical protein